ncbi:DUF2255 family protein [Mycobacterium parmense]|uniref:Uncharacterized protein n=1 Tax=Mycobacterium parmense TaxID=185642 RepID=A0A7I7YUH8_9MYCO|nr:DUF2255 family protein [Mycobacterium parmense]MCV7351037.1 DUF2255 family protein [Mycobacterium parmense]ORW60610.1 hypothetical protein AWC20_06430 [Mycobacterium parmense]BBZ45525.1 hypothetical protein MPRM_28060 [Mycobacterium parmense]
MTWTPSELERIDRTTELEIAVYREDGTPRPGTPIWVVCADGEVYVRTWYRRTTGWFGLALRTGRARVRAPGLEADVRVVDVGAGPAALRAAVDDAYRQKYQGDSTSAMVRDEAAATTLRLRRE